MLKKKNIFRWDLGLKDLIPQWRRFFTLKDLKEDMIAGATVACIAIPLSLAIALASGVPPAVGLVTAVVASIICAFFGGTPLSVTGPAAAMAVLIASVMQQHGVTGLLIVGFGCGILQLLTGIFGLGSLISFVPLPVVTGFTAGIGAIIFIGQLPRALGLPPPDQSHVINVLKHLRELILDTNGTSLFLSMLTLGIVLMLPKINRKIPASLFAVIVPSILVFILNIKVQTIGNIPNSLPLPKFPDFSEVALLNLIFPTLIVYSLASLETLLSSSAVDKISKGEKHNSNQEMIGQGLGNIITAFFGGIPVTGVIARSALNVQSGARTRRAAIFHGVLLLLSIYFFSFVMEQIPVAVLAGILLAVALRMLNVREFLELWHASRIEAIIYGVTFLTIVSVDLIAGVQAGIVAALVIVAIRFGRARIFIQNSTTEAASHLSLSGVLTFLSVTKLNKIRDELKTLENGDRLVIDMAEVSDIDTSGLSQLQEIISDLFDRNVKVALKAMSPKVRKALCTSEIGKRLEGLIAYSDTDVARILGIETSVDFLSERVILGVERFRRGRQSNYLQLFEELATKGQKPHTLFITCCDSRIDPSLITSTEPGELFIVRNVGNSVPHFGKYLNHSEAAAIEFAVGVLGVGQIIVCGHTECGALNAVITGKLTNNDFKSKYPGMTSWLQPLLFIEGHFERIEDLQRASEINVTKQMENLMTYPIVSSKVNEGKLRILGWFYDVRRAEITRWDEQTSMFVRLEQKAS